MPTTRLFKRELNSWLYCSFSSSTALNVVAPPASTMALNGDYDKYGAVWTTDDKKKPYVHDLEGLAPDCNVDIRQGLAYMRPGKQFALKHYATHACFC